MEGEGLLNFLFFRLFVTVPIMPILFWVLVGLCLFGSVKDIVNSFGSSVTMDMGSFGRQMHGSSFNGWMFFYGLVQLVVGPVLIRLFCEFLVAIIRIMESLQNRSR